MHSGKKFNGCILQMFKIDTIDKTVDKSFFHQFVVL